MPASTELWVWSDDRGITHYGKGGPLKHELWLLMAASGHQHWDRLTSQLVTCHKSPLSLTGSAAGNGFVGFNLGGVAFQRGVLKCFRSESEYLIDT